jgi:hypothetical protein
MNSTKIPWSVLFTLFAATLSQAARAEHKHVPVKDFCQSQLPNLETSYVADVYIDRESKAEADRYLPLIRAQDAAAHANLVSQVQKLEKGQIMDVLRDFDRGATSAQAVADDVSAILQIETSSTVTFDPRTLVLTVSGKPVSYHDRSQNMGGPKPSVGSPAEGETVEQSQFELWLGEKSARDGKHFVVPPAHTDGELKAGAQWISFKTSTQGTYDDYLRTKMDPSCFEVPAAPPSSAFTSVSEGKPGETPPAKETGPAPAAGSASPPGAPSALRNN